MADNFDLGSRETQPFPADVNCDNKTKESYGKRFFKELWLRRKSS